MKQPSSRAGRGRPSLGGPPRQPQSFHITDYQIAHLKTLDPSGRSVMAAGFRALLAQSMARAAAHAEAQTKAVEATEAV